jgi:hypothetical protein
MGWTCSWMEETINAYRIFLYTPHGRARISLSWVYLLAFCFIMCAEPLGLNQRLSPLTLWLQMDLFYEVLMMMPHAYGSLVE